MTRKPLDPSPEEMRQLGYNFVDRWVEHLTTLSEQPVAQRGTYNDFMSLVDEPLSSSGHGVESSLDFFFEQVAPGMTVVNHPRFHGYIPCPSSFVGALGDMLASGTNPFLGSWLGGATLAALELTTLRWIREMLQCEELKAGIFTSGGSMANSIGLASARAKYGLQTLKRGTMYVSEEGHASLNKAAVLLGFPKESIRVIRVDQHFRMDLNQLHTQLEADRQAGHLPFFVSGNAGTTNTGAIDPLDALATICNEQDMWFHIDAAYGGFAALLPEVREQMKGLDRADSITLDPHKWLYCPMGVGCALVRDTQALEAAFSTEGRYLKDIPEDEVNFFNRGPELSRRARVLPVWMLLRSVGKDAITEQIAEDIRLAELTAELLQKDERLEVMPPTLSIVGFRHKAHPNETEEERAARDTALMEATLASGTLMLSTTTLHGKSTLRMAVMNHRTTEAEVQRSVECIRKFVVP